jgi:hypothetical protein
LIGFVSFGARLCASFEVNKVFIALDMIIVEFKIRCLLNGKSIEDGLPIQKTFRLILHSQVL